MMCDRFYIRIPFSIFLWCFRCTQRLDDLFHLHGEYQSIRIPFNCIDQFPVFFPIQGFRHVIRSVFRPPHSPMLHPQSDRGTVLALLDSHIFIDDPFPGFRKFYPSLLIRQKPFFVIIKISIQFPGLFTPLIFCIIAFFSVRFDLDLLQHLI